MMPAIDPADDSFAPSGASPSSIARGVLLCEIAGLSLAVPQADIVTIEHGAELSASLPGEPEIGWLNGAHGPWPAYALDSQLNLLPAARASGSFLVFVKAHPCPAGLLCESVRVVRARSELNVQPLPAVMQSHGVALYGVARIDKSRLAIVLGEGALAAHLAHIVSHEVNRE